MASIDIPAKGIKFTGPYPVLRSMGFEFARLYASNYMSWGYHDLRIWKRGNDMTIGPVSGMEGQLLQMMIDQTPTPVYLYGDTAILYYHKITNELTSDDSEYMRLRGTDDNPWAYTSISKVNLEMIKRLYDAGWIEVEDYTLSHYVPNGLASV